jgi:hypothetical protein
MSWSQRLRGKYPLEDYQYYPLSTLAVHRLLCRLQIPLGWACTIELAMVPTLQPGATGRQCT